MFKHAWDWEILSFFLLVGAFELWERLRPARSVNKLVDLKLDLLSFALAVLMASVSRRVVDSMVGAVSPDFVLVSLDYIRAWPDWLKIAVTLVLVDFTIYWIHRAQHRFDFMWRTHKWHHSIEQMYWFAGFRTSFVHSFIYNIPQTVVPMQLFHLSPLAAGAAYSLGLFIQFWEHTNVKVNIGWLRYIFITPQYHRVHHSVTAHQGMNLGTTFSLWDRMLAPTWIRRRCRRAIRSAWASGSRRRSCRGCSLACDARAPVSGARTASFRPGTVMIY